jgi:hypothetical protein
MIDGLIFNSKQQLLSLFAVESESDERCVLMSERKIQKSPKTKTQNKQKQKTIKRYTNMPSNSLFHLSSSSQV